MSGIQHQSEDWKKAKAQVRYANTCASGGTLGTSGAAQDDWREWGLV